MNILSIIIGIILGIIIRELYRFVKEKLPTLSPNRSKIKNIIEKTINSELKDTMINTFNIPILNKKVEIRWGKERETYHYLSKEGDLIIVLSTKTNINIVNSFCNSLMLYLDEVFMPQSKYFIGEDLYNICKIFIGFDVVKRRGNDFISYFREKYFNPVISNIKESENIILKINLIIKMGLFKTIFLREIYFLSISSDLHPSDTIRKEVTRFLNFLYNIANKDEYIKASRGNEPPLDFEGNFIRIGIVLVKRLEIEEFTPHLRRIENYINYNYNRIYVTGWGKINIEGLQYIENILRNKKDLECDISKYKLSNSISFIVEFQDRNIDALMLVISRE